MYPLDVRLVGGPVRGIVSSWDPPAPAAAYAVLWRVNVGGQWGTELVAPDADNPNVLEVHRYELDGDPVDDVATYRHAERER